jgi:26S proteasome regulatory subunit N8
MLINYFTLIQDGTATTRTFSHIPSSIEAEEAEEIGVEHLLRDIKDISAGTLSTQIGSQLDSLKGLAHHLNEIRDYLGQVTEGRLPVNHEILTHLQDVFNLLPNMNLEEVVKSFAIMTNDEMLAMYLSSLVRAVIALHGLIDNKVMLREAENKDDEKVNAAVNPAPIEEVKSQ